MIFPQPTKRKTTPPIFSKLVRSKVPELRKRDSSLTVITRLITDPQEKRFWLVAKLAEEVDEFRCANAIDRVREAADVLAVLEAFAQHDLDPFKDVPQDLYEQALSIIREVREDFSAQLDAFKEEKARAKGDFKTLTVIQCEYPTTKK